MTGLRSAGRARAGCAAQVHGVGRIRGVAVLVAAGAVVAGGSVLAPSASAVLAHQGARRDPVRSACPPAARPGVAVCLALVRTDVKAHMGLYRPGVTPLAAPPGYGPTDLQSAYRLPSSTAGVGATVAVVDAYNDPTAAADLAVYRQQYGLPACTAASGCFRVVNQQGQASPLPPDAGSAPGSSGWDVEESLDVDMVSAVCPRCKIILVESNSASVFDLGAAEDTAVSLGARYVSNSYGTADQAAETGLDRYYDHPGVVITASGGDSGYGVNYPSGSRYVTAVGGTSLVKAPSMVRGWAETVWGTASAGEGTGSGCSGFEHQPTWQAGVISGCARRVTTDVSAVADPRTGVAMYDTSSQSGWVVVGGTSVASPIIASTFALAGLPASGTYPVSYLYDHFRADPAVFHDVTSGANGTCTPNVLCTAGKGWDGPTGLGSPDGVAGFKYARTGSVTGTVTDTATARPATGVSVSVPGLSVTTGSTGKYTLAGLPVGRYQVHVSGYGYQRRAVIVTVTANHATTQNIAVTRLPHETVSGSVTAGTGTPWPLYAKVSWSDGKGHSGHTHTVPATGKYRLRLYADSHYTFTVAPLHPGYLTPVPVSVTVGTRNVTRDFTAKVDLVACTAIGYHAVLSGATQRFKGARIPPGWRVTNTDLHLPGYVGTPGWVFDNPGHRANRTGGTKNFAIVDSGHDGPNHYQDTHLISPSVNFALDKKPVVQFATDLIGTPNTVATVGVSVNGGKTWTTVWRAAGAAGVPGPTTVVISLPQAVGRKLVRVRFGYAGQWSRYWEIDDVFLGNRACVARGG